MDTKKLLLAVRLGETLHFGKAAEIENMAQSGLSAQIAKLESELGFRLFVRANRKVALTEAGEIFIKKARVILADMHNSIVECKALSDNKRSVLKVGMFGDQAAEYTHPMFALFQRLNPDIRLVFIELQMTNQVQSLVGGIVDVVLMRIPTHDDRLEYVELFKEHRVAVVPATHELASLGALTVADLLDKPFAIPAEGAPSDLISYWSLADVRNEPSKVAATVKTIPEVISAVAYGGAFDTFPSSLTKAYDHPGIRYIPIEDASLSAMSLATLEGNRSPGIRALRYCAEQTFAISFPR
ncbi:LysR substrate-binding domain-containing protein [Pseudomonas aeruginosa]|uniref:LysR substrate-binding domain-containing protein n=1 Tax=Pseudomonas aeruginosa TaxID=287 RepID=UPI001A2177D2|nr:LysR family transcriptional regulator [Pseudomonas aeruginosa]MBH9249427.1 LysR family transcriptional regulator [Pseudomonas aeruginosa]